MTPPKEKNFRYPDWYLEAMAGAALLDDRDRYDDAEKVRYLARQALASYIGLGIRNSQGNIILGEDGSTQLEALHQQMDRLLKKVK